MMIKANKMWMAVCLVGALSMGFVSCGGDDEDENKKPEVENPNSNTGGGEEPGGNNPGGKPAGDNSPSWVKAVDLGLSVKWASGNVGANSEADYGDYFSWGEVATKSLYNQNTYKMWDLSKSSWVDIGYDIYGTDHDVAHVRWGGTWRMPLASEFRELIEKCTVQETTVGGVKVVRFTAANGNSIVLPEAGYREGGNVERGAVQCCYWSSSASMAGSPYLLMASKDADVVVWGALAFRGLTIRPVTE